MKIKDFFKSIKRVISMLIAGFIPDVHIDEPRKGNKKESINSGQVKNNEKKETNS